MHLGRSSVFPKSILSSRGLYGSVRTGFYSSASKALQLDRLTDQERAYFDDCFSHMMMVLESMEPDMSSMEDITACIVRAEEVCESIYSYADEDAVILKDILLNLDAALSAAFSSVPTAPRSSSSAPAPVWQTKPRTVSPPKSPSPPPMKESNALFFLFCTIFFILGVGLYFLTH